MEGQFLLTLWPFEGMATPEKEHLKESILRTIEGLCNVVFVGFFFLEQE